MKLRNLFLVSLAAMAMASCSNEVEGVDNGNFAKDAKMQLAITFPQTNKTRAGENDLAKGEAYEQQINDLTVVVVNGRDLTVVSYTSDELVNGKVETTKVNMTPVFEVSAGTVNVYAYVNYGKGSITAGNYTTYEENASYAGLSINNNVANVEGANFHMNGSTANVEISPNVTNYAQVVISRVAAKITEATAEKSYTHEDLEYGANLTIELTDYSLVNLGKKVNVLSDNATSITSENAYNFYAGSSNETYQNLFENMPQAGIDAKNKDSYCLANQSSGNATHVIYKAKATFAEVDGVKVTDEDGTFYIRNNKEGTPTVYSLAQLQSTYPGVYNNCDQNTTTEDWSKLGVKKYTEGYCYYKHAITTATEGGNAAEILRNNLYLLNVTNIKDLGTPELDTPNPDPTTLLEVEVIIKAWTFNQNDITLG